ncbi:serine/threonine-protein kinase VRK1-like protein [Dinothrombium tinctorium]|uniref:non-specific serine/threonine protein kinase n=1 Tax=Dinothrombium tinctorium TaxID=1965070 RepID=A0A443RQ47_9ACAR|nr:serine/threonine-protein kinase VRK1-like protein [Dinothrombium tinctorium]
MSKVRKTANAVEKAKRQVLAPRVADNGYRLPDPLPKGEILTDSVKTQWIIGESIGCGGFGEIYAAKRLANNAEVNGESDYDYVAKVDNYNGPLFAEIHFYHRVAKSEEVNKWMQKEGLKFLGIPRYIASGLHKKTASKTIVKSKNRMAKSSKLNQNNEMPDYRFLIMQRFGKDLQSILNENNKFDLKTAYTIAIKVIDTLKYIHHNGYIHADVKASNLLLGRKRSSRRLSNDSFDEIYLVDYGLVERYITREGEHRNYEEDQRRAHNGTIEFTSRDAHIGALSRRSDLEILAYNILSWLSGGKLPWMSNLKDHRYVKECKEYYMKNLHELVNYCFGKNDNKTNLKPKATQTTKPVVDRKKISPNVPHGIVEVLQYIANLEFTEEPDYHLLKKILENGIEKSGERSDGTFNFNSSSRRSNITVGSKSPLKRKAEDNQDKGDTLSNAKESPKRTRRLVRAKTGNVLKKARSVPTTLTPQKGNTEQSPQKTPFNNPTPQMLELLKKMKEKKLNLKYK